MTSFPYDLHYFIPDRAQRLPAWPISVGVVRSLNGRLHQGLRDLGVAIDDPRLRTAFTVGGPPILVTLLTLGTALMTVDAARREQLELEANERSIASALILGEVPDCDIFFDRIREMSAAASKHNWSNIPRRIAHRLITNRRLGSSRHRVTVLNHNKLLQSVARADRSRMFFYETPDRILDGDVAIASRAAPAEIEDLAVSTTEVFCAAVEDAGVETPTSLKSAIKGATAAWLATVEAQRNSVAARWRSVPDELWTGTGGNHVTRLAAAQVLNAGGRVVVHEHGGSGHIHHDLGPLHLHEFSLCDVFVADTDEKAETYRGSIDTDQIWTPAAPAISGRPNGGHSFAWLRGARPREIRRVMYVTTAFVGEVQYPLQPLLPDVVYADWQGRLLDGLAGLGYEVLCKPHPEGLLGGSPLKTSREAEYVGGLFHEIADQADAFIFDYPATTALWEAICTEKAVVFLDLGLADWNQTVWDKFTRRCAVVSARFDDGNRPHVDFAEVAAALRDAPADDAFATAYLTGRAR